MNTNYFSPLRPVVVAVGAMLLSLAIAEPAAGQAGRAEAAIAPRVAEGLLPMVTLDDDKTQSQDHDCPDYLRRCPTSMR
jgi:hypothetical protein